LVATTLGFGKPRLIDLPDLGDVEAFYQQIREFGARFS
jgi:hypothetical protein